MCGKPVRRDRAETRGRRPAGRARRRARARHVRGPAAPSLALGGRPRRPLAAGFIRALDDPATTVDLDGAARRHARPARDRPGPARAPRERPRRLVDSLEQALRHGRGRVTSARPTAALAHFSTALECAACHFTVRDPVPNLFSFNSPLGACEPAAASAASSTSTSISSCPIREDDRGGAVEPWTTQDDDVGARRAAEALQAERIPTDVPWRTLTDEQRRSSSTATARPHAGIRGWFKWLEGRTYKMHVRVFLARYRSYVECRRAAARGSSPRRSTSASRQDRRRREPPADRRGAPLLRAAPAPRGQDAAVAETILAEVQSRLRYLVEVGLEYLTLDRQSRTLSGGELERVDLTTAVGSSLVNTLYVLDEPSIGLHPRDTDRLIRLLHRCATRATRSSSSSTTRDHPRGRPRDRPRARRGRARRHRARSRAAEPAPRRRAARRPASS
jgi:excinuclease ABC subunit A